MRLTCIQKSFYNTVLLYDVSLLVSVEEVVYQCSTYLYPFTERRDTESTCFSYSSYFYDVCSFFNTP